MMSSWPLRKLDLNLVLVFLLSVFVFAPLTYPGFYQSHSGFLPVFNLYDLERDLWGNWGWVPQVGTSWNLLTGEGPLPYLLAELLRWMGLGGVQAIKGVYLLGFVASGMSMYVLGRKLYGPPGGMLAAVAYVYLPWHVATVYVRGAFAEAWAFALYPVVLWCWERYLSERRALWAASAVLAYAALGSTNLGLALLYALFVLGFIVLTGASPRARKRGLLVLALALVVALLLQVPALAKHGFGGPSHVDFTQHFVYPFQLLSASWGHGFSVPGWEDTLPLQLGLAATGLSMVGALLVLQERQRAAATSRTVAFFVVAAAVTVLLVMQPAIYLWQASQLSVLLSYPWQLLAIAGLAMSLASGATVRLEPRLAGMPWQAVLVALVVVASYNYLSPRFTDVQVGGSPEAVFGDEVVLLAHERQGPLRHGATVRLTLFWQSLRPVDTDYTVFVHVTDADGTIWAQRDSMPVGGERPTSSWQLGEIIEDQYEMIIDVEGPREGYSLELGLYDHTTGTRLPLSTGGLAITLQ